MHISPESLPHLKPEEFLDWEREQETRHELVDGYLYTIPSASDRHEEIALNLACALKVHLRGGSCRVYKGDLKIRENDDFFYPDVFVRCDESRGDPYFKTDPVLIAEVLSPNTARYDRGDKRAAYWRLPTLGEYVLIWQDRMRVELSRRDIADPIILEQPDETLRLESVGLSLTLAELYE